MTTAVARHVFLSCAHSDRPVAGRIRAALTQRGLSSFPPSGERLGHAPGSSAGGLGLASSVLLILGASGPGKRQESEIRHALERRSRDPLLPVIALLLPDAGPELWVPLLGGEPHFLRYREDGASLDRLAAALRGKPAATSVRGLRARRFPRSLADLDRVPTPLVLALGLIPAALLGTLALQRPTATALLMLLIPAAAVWQGRRVRVVWERGIPAEIEEVPPARRRPQLPGPAVAPAEPEAPQEPQPPYAVRDRLIDMMALPGGTFRMGSDKALDRQARDNELPRREVGIRPFAMARTPVTRGLYRSLTAGSPREWGKDTEDDALPANYLSWEDAVRFCNVLSERSDRRLCYRPADEGWECDWDADGYRLPTEAEWEYACRAGTDTPWFWGGDEKDAARYAWFGEDRTTGSVHPVSSKGPNDWGLHDMVGNVWEWCWDWYADAYDAKALVDPRGPAKGHWRVLRGGSFHSEPRNLRSAVRDRRRPGLRDVRIGFRCVRGSVRQPDR